MNLPEGARSRMVDVETPLGAGRLHVVEAGAEDAPAILLLHGWPEFWGGWLRTIPALAAEFRVIAPDLRGFGASAGGGQRAESLDLLAADQRALLDALGIAHVAVVAHDVGAYVAQALALAAPDRVRGLFFGNCPYPGIGRRWVEDGQVNEIWYQSFNQQPWAPALVGADRESCRRYIGHFLAHWSADPAAFDPVLDDWIDVFMAPGVLAGGFAWYSATNAARLAQIAGGPQPRAPITQPTRVFWGRHDPVLRADWAEGLTDYFTDIEIEIAETAGHFVFFEAPEEANPRLLTFLRGLAA
ncbi:MAG: alpha/beta fold hydrolase [Pseudomonadota bacterium]